jgi:hypothetical protein
MGDLAEVARDLTLKTFIAMYSSCQFTRDRDFDSPLPEFVVSRMAPLGRDVTSDAEIHPLVGSQVASFAEDRLLSQRDCCQIFRQLDSA